MFSSVRILSGKYVKLYLFLDRFGTIFPRVSYISFLDIWMLISVLFVFSCILEFIIMTVLLRSGRKENAEKVTGFQPSQAINIFSIISLSP